MAIPRIGHEVVVTFLEGDPDRPVITGRVYHGGNTPPYDLPEHKTRTVFRSRSTPDGKGPCGFNEFRIEDKAGEEEIYVRAEKDMNIHVKNDWKKHILRDRRQQVDNYDYTHIKGETHISLNCQRKTELRSDDHLTINADSHVRIDQQWLLKAGTEIHVASGARILLEAGAELTVKAGGSWIKLDASGVSINGKKIYISGGGKAGVGMIALPQRPVHATDKDKYIRDFLFVEDGKPLAYIPYTVSVKGKNQAGTTDILGRTQLYVDDEEQLVQVNLDQPIPINIG